MKKGSFSVLDGKEGKRGRGVKCQVCNGGAIGWVFELARETGITSSVLNALKVQVDRYPRGLYGIVPTYGHEPMAPLRGSRSKVL